MGMLNNIVDAVTGGQSDPVEDSPEIDEVFDEDDVIEDDEAVEHEEDAEIGEEEQEEEVRHEWDSAYDFASWWLEDSGFASMKDFGEKAMMHRLEQSPMFRDRIQSGVRTLQTIDEAKQHMESIKGNDTGERNYEQMAEKLENANRVIENTRKLSGEDEVIMQQGMSLARDAIQAIGGEVASGGGSVDSQIEHTDDRI